MDGRGILIITAAGSAGKTWIHPVSTEMLTQHSVQHNMVFSLKKFSTARKQNNKVRQDKKMLILFFSINKKNT